MKKKLKAVEEPQQAYFLSSSAVHMPSLWDFIKSSQLPS